MASRPSEIITKVLKHSISELKYAESAMHDVACSTRHQLLLPNSHDGLYNALTAYRELLTEAQFVVPMRREIKQLLAEYDTQWVRLCDTVRDTDKALADLVDDVRSAQKAAHDRLVAILTDADADGKEEFAALTEALTALSEELGRISKSAAKRSRKGIKHETTHISAPRAAKLTGLSAITIRRHWKNPGNFARPPLNANEEAVIAWGKLYQGKKAAAHEANAKNHAIPISCVGSKSQQQAGFTR